MIPEKFKIDFSKIENDAMLERATGRLLSQFWPARVMRAALKAFIDEVELSYARIVEFQRQNTLYDAVGENLDAIGRIVGQPRSAYQYDESKWMFADRQGQGADQQLTYVTNAPMFGMYPPGDEEYRQYILARIACNMCRFSSEPEMEYLVDFSMGRAVSWTRTGPMQVDLNVESTISRTHLNLLTMFKTNARCDEIYPIPYPATISVGNIRFLPKKPFIADRENGHQADAGGVAVAKPVGEYEYGYM